MFAYVFLHWKRDDVRSEDYERRQRDFHEAMKREPSVGFSRSHSFRVANLPWAEGGASVYEDWYFVADFPALGLLNQAAVSASRAAPHDRAAVVAAGGAGGLYQLKHGAPETVPRYASWFSKPDGMPYDKFFALLQPAIAQSRGALWMRQMVLGPAREFSLHTAAPLVLPSPIDPLVVPLHAIWP